MRAAAVTETAAGVAFDLLAAGRGPRVRLSAHGRVMVHNALAAAAVGTLLGLSPEGHPGPASRASGRCPAAWA